MTTHKIIERIERDAGLPGLTALLAERLSPTDLQSVLLEVYRQLAQNREPSEVLSAYETDPLVRPSARSPLDLLAWERSAFAALPPDFEAVALAPVCPLGTSSAVALVSQNKVLSTIRNTEVVSDSTNVMALECAYRRKQLLRAAPKSRTPIHLAASHRLLRTQQYKGPNLVAHFSAFGLCSAGRDEGSLAFELTTLRRHIGVYVRALRAFLGSEVILRVAVTDFGP
ncbi:MAG TPA: hypothetical protein VMT34_03435, partial [Aggregatilineales bacterium]|nr:hypothetical protein [Aggregatilineales bacterium]